MFDFVSPFDALANSVPNQQASIKRNAVHIPVPATAGQSSGDDSSFQKVTHPLEGMRTDPKRKSVENLMDTLTRGSLPGHPGPPPPEGPQQQVSQGGTSRTVSESRPPPAKRQPPSPPPVFAPKPSQSVNSPVHALSAPTRDQVQQSYPRNEAQVHNAWRTSDTRPKQTSKEGRSQDSRSQDSPFVFFF